MLSVKALSNENINPLDTDIDTYIHTYILTDRQAGSQADRYSCIYAYRQKNKVKDR
jgi:hypothetical protein